MEVKTYRLFVLAALSSMSLACGDTTTTVGVLPEFPSPPTPEQLADAEIHIVSGEGQEGEVNTVLPDSLVVEVVTSSGVPLGGAPVEWRFDAGHPPIEGVAWVPDQRLVTITDRTGKAWTRWQLGTVAGDQSVSVRVMVDDPVIPSGAQSLAPRNRFRYFWSRARPGTPASVAVAPTATRLAAGDSVRLIAEVKDRYGNVLQGSAVTWSSSAPTIAAVRSTGVTRGLQAGTATIRATSGDATGTSRVEVTSGATTTPPTLTIRSQSGPLTNLSLEVGESVSLSVTAVDGSGAPLGTVNPSWSSTNSSVASVSSSGVVRALSVGNTTIVATYLGATKSVQTTVVATEAAPPPTSGGFASNAPPGLSTVVDCDFTQTWSGGSGTLGCGLRVTDWNRSGYPSDQCRTIADATSIFGGRVWESHYDNGSGGSGPCLLERSLSSPRDSVYVAMRVKYQSGWQANNTSQKIIYVDTDRGAGDGLFEYTYGAEAVMYVTSATGCDHLESNVASAPLKSPPESPPCQNQRATGLTAGRWDTFEFLWSCTDGTVKWWKNGELRGSHRGRSIGCVNNLRFPDTWGGGGTLNQEQSRYYDRIIIRASSN